MKNEKGFILVLAMMMILLLTVMGLAASKSSIFEIKLAGNQYQSLQAFYNAESGLELFRYDLGKGNIVDNAPASTTWTYEKTYTDNGIKAIVKGEHVLYVDAGTTKVKTINGHPVYRLTSHGYQNESHRVTEAVFQFNPTLDVPAALWSRASVNVKGSSTYIDGKDKCGGVGTDKPGVETKGTVTPSGGPIIDGAPPTNENISTNYPIEDTIASLKVYANVSESYTTDQNFPGKVYGDVQEGSTPQDPTTPLTDPKIVYYNMNGKELTLNGAEGTGILMVDGNLKVGGTFQWYGIIIVTGTITFSGGGEKNITGGVISGGTPNVDASVGGNMSIVYCGKIKDYLQKKVQPTQRKSWREVF